VVAGVGRVDRIMGPAGHLGFGPGKACHGEGSTGPTPRGWLALPGMGSAGDIGSNYDGG